VEKLIIEKEGIKGKAVKSKRKWGGPVKGVTRKSIISEKKVVKFRHEEGGKGNGKGEKRVTGNNLRLGKNLLDRGGRVSAWQ